MPREMEFFIVVVVLSLTAAWVAAFRVILKIAESRQRAWAWFVTALIVGGALGCAALVAADRFMPPRTITGTVRALGDGPDRNSVLAYTVVLDGSTYWVRRADYTKLQIGERIRGQAGAALNFLDRIEVMP
jgi:hypothetical protein